MITQYPILLSSVALLICGFILIFSFLFLVFQLSCYISIIGFFGLLCYFYLFNYLFILPKSTELFLYVLLQLLVITLFFLFVCSIITIYKRISFE